MTLSRGIGAIVARAGRERPARPMDRYVFGTPLGGGLAAGGEEGLIGPLPSSVVIGCPVSWMAPLEMVPICAPSNPACDWALYAKGTSPGPDSLPLSTVLTMDWRVGFAPASASASANV